MKGKKRKSTGSSFAAIMAAILVFVMLLDVVLYATGMATFIGT